MTRLAILLRRIITALIFGAAVTVALAWLAMFLPRGNAWSGPRLEQDLGLWMQDDGKTWLLRRGDNAWHSAVDYWHIQASGLSLMIPTADYEACKFDFRQLPRHLRPNSLSGLNMSATYHETGWPFKALACSVHWKQQIANADVLYTVRGGLQLPRDQDFNPRALPLTPLWLGAAANIAIFAVAWLLATTVRSAARKRLRRRRGQCTHCAYARAGLSADSPCPECGRL